MAPFLFCLAVLLCEAQQVAPLALSSSSSPATDELQENEPPHEPSLLIRPVLRVKSMSVAEFKNKHSRSDVAIPMIFEGPKDFDVSQWTRQAFADECGDVPILMPVDGCDPRTTASSRDSKCHKVRVFNPDLVGEEWAGLDTADLEAHNITTLKDLLDRQETPSGSGLYLHDAALSHYCPAKVESLEVPKYFTRNYESFEFDPETVDSIGEEAHFPSIFISKKGTGSRLHADAYMTRFWAQQLSGTKRWMLVPPSEYWRMAPAEYGDYYPTVFSADILDPDFSEFPALDGALVYEAVLRPGDVLFSPEGWGHQVINLEDAIMTSLNFLDNDNLDVAYKCSKYDDDEDEDEEVPLPRAFFMPLDDPLWDDSVHIKFEDYFRSQHLQREPVPSSVIDWVDEKGEEGVKDYRDDLDRPALHVAVAYNFLSVVEYLLEEGWVDVNMRNPDGATALDIAEEEGFEDASQLLQEYGALHGATLEVGEEECAK